MILLILLTSPVVTSGFLDESWLLTYVTVICIFSRTSVL